MYIGIALCVLIVFSLRQESLKLIHVDEPLPEGILSHPNPSPSRLCRRGRSDHHGGPLMGRARPHKGGGPGPMYL
jgi:hypothetical protein